MNREDVLLTDEEMAVIVKKHNKTVLDMWSKCKTGHVDSLANWQNQAELRKVVGWLDGPCNEHLHVHPAPIKHIDCPRCITELREIANGD